MPERLTPPQNFADRLGISKSTLYRRIKDWEGFPQPVKIGTATRFRESEIDAFIAGLGADQDPE